MNAQLRILLARSCMSAFVRHTMPGYLMGWVHERICAELDQFLEDVVEGRSPRLMLTMPPRHGKLCADGTEVPTPDGWKLHGDLRPGDMVLGLNGQPVRVVAVGEPAMATHRVLFTNGAAVAVHPAHEWTLYDKSCRRWRTVETKKLFLEALRCGGRGMRWGLPSTPATGKPAHVLAVEPLREPLPGRCIQDQQDCITMQAMCHRQQTQTDVFTFLTSIKINRDAEQNVGEDAFANCNVEPEWI